MAQVIKTYYPGNTGKLSLARVWRGRTPRSRADEYEAYNFEAGIVPLRERASAVQTFKGPVQSVMTRTKVLVHRCSVLVHKV